MLVCQYSCCLCVELLLDFYFLEGFDDVAFLDVVAVGQADTALEVGVHFLHVVFEAFERVDFAREDYDAVADEACLVAALHLAVDHVSTGHVTNLGDVVNLTHLDVGGKFFLDNGFEHAFHGFLNVLDSVVDDGATEEIKKDKNVVYTAVDTCECEVIINFTITIDNGEDECEEAFELLVTSIEKFC